MNISNLFNFSTFSSKNQPRTTAPALTEVSPLAQAVQRADVRLQSEVNTNTAQMSSFGQLKSSVSQVQITAKALSGLNEKSTTAQTATTLNQLLEAVNAAISLANTTAALPGASEAAQSATRVASDLQKLVTDKPFSEALSALGISLQNQTFTVDANTFNASMANDLNGSQATLAKLGQKLDDVSSQELASDGDVIGPLNQLQRQAHTLQAQQSALASAAQATSTYAGNSSRYGVHAYQANFG
jgi:hypothetical protein